ncbi:C-type lectin domain family 4 member G-like isoform X2 [Diceros bicornis minor]|uniref:C-type lectin domain family 4 member G-like isoform X2 n=1 Tax=Diceros bicornis minor TaxID=77932 RepID=UPI0026EB8C8D|nr:C-type lectin domain family 4 member G-like isoform X2 [Diceros bicornis minor]
MDNAGYSKWGCDLEEAPGESWRHWGWRLLWLAVTFMIATILWGLILTIGLSKAATEHGALLGYQDLLRTNASEQMEVLAALKEEIQSCKRCCQGTQAQLQTARTQLGEAQAKLFQQESALKELSERVTQGLAEAGRDREGIRAELLRALEAARLGNRPCEQCPASWLPFQGSCYLFSELKATWEEAQHNCTSSGAHLVIVEDLDEQGFLSRNTRGRGYWLGLRAVRRAGIIQAYQWVDGVSLSFSHWRQGEPNDSGGREDCVMMLDTGMWNDAPCSDDERDNWICEKRQSC